MSDQGNSDKKSTAIIVAAITGIAAVVAGIGAAVVPLLAKDSPPTSTPSVSEVYPPSIKQPPSTPPVPPGQPVKLSVTPAGHRTVAVTAELNRPARSGYAYWFVLEVHQVSNTHSEFYPRQNLTSGGTSFEISIPDDADAGRPRTGRVFEVTGEMSKRMESGHPNADNLTADFLLQPPCNCRASNEITLDFRD